MEAETRGMQPQVKECQEPPDVGRGKEQIRSSLEPLKS